MQDQIEYEARVQNALRNVIRDVLADVAVNGLPGEHHFYISFATEAPGVSISPRLKARFPENMTIVLQHRFWDMVVSAESFAVTLSFGGVSEKLVIPFSAMQVFYDPSAAFEVAFNTNTKPEEQQEKGPAANNGDIVAFPPQNRKGEKEQSHGGISSDMLHNLPLPPEFTKALVKHNDHLNTNPEAKHPLSHDKNIAGQKNVTGHDQNTKQLNIEKKQETSASIVSLDAFRKK